LSSLPQAKQLTRNEAERAERALWQTISLFRHDHQYEIRCELYALAISGNAANVRFADVGAAGRRALPVAQPSPCVRIKQLEQKLEGA
jgi:hypothetical protein